MVYWQCICKDGHLSTMYCLNLSFDPKSYIDITKHLNHVFQKLNLLNYLDVVDGKCV